MASLQLYVERDHCSFHVICENAGARVSTDWLNSFRNITG